MMELFVICLCIVFCLVSGNPERGEIANENVDIIMEVIDDISPPPSVPFNDAKMIIYPGQKLPGVEGHKSDLSVPRLSRSGNAESGEMGSFGSPSGILKPRSVTESSSKKRKTLLRVYPEPSDKELNMLQKLAYRRMSAKFSWSLDGVAALRGPTDRMTSVNDARKHKENTGKQMENTGKQMENTGKHKENTRKQMENTRTHKENTGKHMENTRKELLRREKRSKQEDASRDFFESRSKWSEEMRLIPEVLKSPMTETNEVEEKLLVNLAKKHRNKTLIDALKNEYKKAQREERFVLKNLVEGVPDETEAAEVLASYKAVRNAVVWNYTKLDPAYKDFFSKSSKQLDEYNELEKSELEVDAYLLGTLKYPNEAEYNKTMCAKDEYKDLPDAIRTAEQLLHRGNKTNCDDELKTKVTVPHASLSVKESLIDGLPGVLKTQIAKTDEVEEELIQDYAIAPSIPREVLALYDVRKKEERAVLKQVLKEAGSYAPQTLQLYKAIRKGEAWNFTKLNDTYKGFFQKPSAALIEYEALKRDELASVDAFISSSDDKAVAEVYNTSSAKAAESRSVLKSLLCGLPDMLQRKMEETDAAEKQLLDDYAKSGGAPSVTPDDYNARKKAERVLLKQVLKEAGSFAPQFLKLYKAIRKGEAWTHVKLDDAVDEFFQKSSATLVEYETLKRDEFSSLDTFLIDQISAVALGKEEDEEMAEAEDKNEKGEEMDRKIREQKAEMLRNEEMESMEASGDASVTTQDVNGTNDILRSPDNVTAADHARNNDTTNQGHGYNSKLVRISVLLSMPINATLAILVMGMYRKDLVRLCGRKKTSRTIPPDDGEKEYLHFDRTVADS